MLDAIYDAYVAASPKILGVGLPALVAFLWWIYKRGCAQGQREGSLKAENGCLQTTLLETKAAHQKEMAALRDSHMKEIEELRTTHADEMAEVLKSNEELQSQIRPYIARNILCEGLHLHPPSQTLFDPATGKHYCLVCMQKTPPARIEIKDCGGSFHCDICRNTFNDESRPIEVAAIPPSESLLRYRKLFQG